MRGRWIPFGRAVGCQGVIQIELEGLGRIAEALKGSMDLVQLSFTAAGGSGADTLAAAPASEAENDFPEGFVNSEMTNCGAKGM